jgi:uncharacterized protein (DUF433 family)
MELPDFLTQDAFGEIRLTGHRIGLLHVVDRHNEGLSAERLHEEFPSLPLPLIRQVLAFYAVNRAEVDAYVRWCHEEIDRWHANYRPSPGILRIRRLLERIEAADAERAADPTWTTLSVVEKARRIEAEDSRPST